MKRRVHGQAIDLCDFGCFPRTNAIEQRIHEHASIISASALARPAQNDIAPDVVGQQGNAHLLKSPSVLEHVRRGPAEKHALCVLADHQIEQHAVLCRAPLTREKVAQAVRHEHSGVGRRIDAFANARGAGFGMKLQVPQQILLAERLDQVSADAKVKHFLDHDGM